MSLREKATKAIKNVLQMPGKALDSIEGKLKAVDESKRERNTKMIEKNWGSVDNYTKIQDKEKQKQAIKSSFKKL